MIVNTMSAISKKTTQCDCIICNKIDNEKKILFDELVKNPERILRMDLEEIVKIIKV
mgnify:FL=1